MDLFSFKPYMKFSRDVSCLFSFLSPSEAAQYPDRRRYGKDNLIAIVRTEVDVVAFQHAIFSSCNQFGVGVKGFESEIEVRYRCMHGEQMP